MTKRVERDGAERVNPIMAYLTLGPPCKHGNTGGCFWCPLGVDDPAPNPLDNPHGRD